MKKNQKIDRKWYLIDADNQILGRLATEVTQILRGKNKLEFEPNQDLGDFVVIINSQKIKLTRKKADKKQYFQHTGFLGSEKFIKFRDLIKKDPKLIFKKAVLGMMPKNKLSRKQLLRLKIYPNNVHPHQAQKFINL